MLRVAKYIQPLNLLLGGLTYTLGAGIARYLGAVVNWPVFGLGLLAVLPMLIAASLLCTYFRMLFVPLNPDETPRLRERFRVLLLQTAFATLTWSATVGVILFLTHPMIISAGVLFTLTLLLLIIYSVPPLRLSETGYGDLVLAIVFASFLPAIGFLLQTGEIHRILALTAFPLTLLAIAWMLASNFSTFATDQKLGRRSMLIRMTWQRAVPFHHIVILIAFLLFAAAPLFGISWELVWPVFLAFPFAILQVYWLQRIAAGGTPIWKFFNVLVPAVFGLTTYLLSMSFWIR